MTDIKRLLNKKSWTGDEIGRLMITDLVKGYENFLNGKGDGSEGILSNTDKSRLVRRLEGQANIKRYNEFRYVHDYIVSLPMRYNMCRLSADACFWQLYYLLQQTRYAETLQKDLFRYPRIVTQKQFDAMKAADFKRKIKRGYTVESIFFHVIEQTLKAYKNGENTPFNAYYIAAKKQPITNSRIKAKYWAEGENGYYKYPNETTGKGQCRENSRKYYEERHRERERYKQENVFATGAATNVDQILKTLKERKAFDAESDRELIDCKLGEWVDEPEAPADATLFDVLKYVSGFYASYETNSTATFSEFEQDFPELYKAVWDYLASFKELAAIKKIPGTDYATDNTRINAKKLYDADILYFKKKVDTISDDSYSGIAILQPNTNYPSWRVDKNGNYKEPENLRFEFHRAEKLIDEHSEDIADWINTIKWQYREMYAHHAFLAVVGEFIQVQNLEILLEPVRENIIDTLNYLFESMSYDICSNREGEGSRTVDRLKAELESLLQPIKISELLPTEEAVNRARATISFKTFEGAATSFIYELMKGDGDE